LWSRSCGAWGWCLYTLRLGCAGRFDYRLFVACRIGRLALQIFDRLREADAHRSMEACCLPLSIMTHRMCRHGPREGQCDEKKPRADH
jgi:hypothetical protein